MIDKWEQIAMNRREFMQTVMVLAAAAYLADLFPDTKKAEAEQPKQAQPGWAIPWNIPWEIGESPPKTKVYLPIVGKD